LDVQFTVVASVVPNLKSVASVPRPNPVPVTVTVVPPAIDPELGVSLVTVGGPNLKWSSDEIALVPIGVVTVTSTVFATSGGDTAVIEVIVFTVFTVKLVALIEPNLTAVAPVKLAPVIVTFVPPAAGPLVGASFVIVGSATTIGTTTLTSSRVGPQSPSGSSDSNSSGVPDSAAVTV